MKPRTAILAMTLTAPWVFAASAQERDVLRKFFVGHDPPELVCEASHWLGTSSPTTLAALKGTVIWLQFNF